MSSPEMTNSRDMFINSFSAVSNYDGPEEQKQKKMNAFLYPLSYPSLNNGATRGVMTFLSRNSVIRQVIAGNNVYGFPFLDFLCNCPNSKKTVYHMGEIRVPGLVSERLFHFH